MAAMFPAQKVSHQEIGLHGHIDDKIEYVITAASGDAFNAYFYEQKPDALRIFSPGNEFLLTAEEIRYNGNGGAFCEFMFGIDQPLADLVKPEVRNRLALFGTHYRDDGTIEFSKNTSGSQSYSKVFLDGNAVHNYFFFTNGVARGGMEQQQRIILRKLGKLLKRSSFVGRLDEARLLEEMYRLLSPGCAIFLVRLTHKDHRTYQDAFRNLYYNHKSIPDGKYKELCQMANRLKIDEYQQERIRIDAMYNHRDNRRIVDEYKSILIACEKKGQITRLENARLNRLKNLWVRNKIPAALFYTLDQMLKSDRLAPKEERDYIEQTRKILAGFSRRDKPEGRGLRREDMVQLLFAKQQASLNRDQSFEQILLETGKLIDEQIRDGADLRLLEDFSNIITYFDRFDATANHVNQLAFMVNFKLSESLLRSLFGNKRAFDRLRPGLFEALFLKELRQNSYLSHFGRQKIDCLKVGLEAVDQKKVPLSEVMKKLQGIGNRERLSQAVLSHLKQRIRSAYSRYHTRNEQAVLKNEVTEELNNKGILHGNLPAKVFDDAIIWIQKEAMYLNHLLPRILKERNVALREDFIRHSGLDRFYVEELELEYFTLNNLNIDKLLALREKADQAAA